MLIKKITYTFFFVMLFSPLISYVFLEIIGLEESSTYYFRLFIGFYGILFLFFQKKQLIIPAFIYPLIFYIIYIFIWTFFNGEIERRGLFNVVFNNVNVQILLVLIIIYNTKFSDKFIEKSIIIFKFTTIFAVIVSIIQIFDSSYLNPKSLSHLIDTSIYNNRRPSLFGLVEPNELGLTFLPLVSVLFGYMYIKRDKFFLIYLLLGGVVAILTNGRYVIVSFFIILMQYIIYQKHNISGQLKFASFLFLLIIVLYTIMLNLGYNFQDYFAERLFKEGGLQYTTRYLAYELFLMFFPRNLLFGTGVRITDEIKYLANAGGSFEIHVGYLSHLVGFGLMGSLFLFGFWFLLAKYLRDNAKITGYWGSFFAFVVYLWSQATFVQWSIFYYGLFFAFIFDKYFIDKKLDISTKGE